MSSSNNRIRRCRRKMSLSKDRAVVKAIRLADPLHALMAPPLYWCPNMSVKQYLIFVKYRKSTIHSIIKYNIITNEYNNFCRNFKIIQIIQKSMWSFYQYNR